MNRRVECMVAVAAIVCLSSHIAPASEWPEFRGPTGDGISTATKVPVEWSTTENIAWKRELPGSGWSSPLIADGKIYLTAATGSADVGDVSLRAISVDAATGEILRDVEAIRPDPEAAKAMHQKNSLASATPIVDGNRFYVHFGHMGTAALDLEGHVLWQRTDLEWCVVPT